MSTPQQPELRRSLHNAADPNDAKTQLQTQPDGLGPDGGPRHVPEDQQPGHHPEVEQDKPAGAPGGADA